jgi:hypothetical protein
MPISPSDLISYKKFANPTQLLLFAEAEYFLRPSYVVEQDFYSAEHLNCRPLVYDIV